ncbi:MAG: biopolymer transporter ExbD [Gammaproteobacteria bacterium]|nr:biopolymer transporter ExbD [Gammaproteobacteria bacterium]MXW06921.1 biopolymer transporter ExbD [Gammaproteobacteria bacterium]MYC25765.1 biopolymer transporter ExbD [Gammaproteobacteria bacterium]
MALGKQRSSTEDDSDINLTPMLDVVFIMLIFFIVTATFIKQPGLDVLRPEARSAQPKPLVSVLIAVGEAGDVWIDKKQVELDKVRSHIERLHAENPKGGIVIQVDREAKIKAVRAVLEAARDAKVLDVALATED